MTAQPLSDQHVAQACKPGHGEATCAFLLMGPQGWLCAKGTEFERMVEERRATMRAKADNCSGPPRFGVWPVDLTRSES